MIMAIDIDPQKVIMHPLTAGIGGALVGLRFAPGLSWPERAVNVIAGAACAGWIAPAAAELFELVSTASQAALAFAIGMFGMSIAAALIDAVRATQWSDIITSWTKRR